MTRKFIAQVKHSIGEQNYQFYDFIGYTYELNYYKSSYVIKAKDTRYRFFVKDQNHIYHDGLMYDVISHFTFNDLVIYGAILPEKILPNFGTIEKWMMNDG